MADALGVLDVVITGFVDGDEPLGIQSFFEIEEALEGLPTLYSFDWVDLAKTNNRFREEALKTAKVIYEG